jgi:hypothetical protein
MTTAAPQPLDLAHDETSSDDSYSPEMEAQDSIFNRAAQTELRRQIADMEAGRNVVHNPRNIQ